jgi:exo-1,4-beta-D-glucosaminidase
MTFVVTRAGGTASRVPVRSWQVASTADAGHDGAVISRPGYDAQRWLPSPPRSTAMAALLANGRHPQIFFSTTMRDEVDRSRFAVPWWFRTLFTVAGAGRTHVSVGGVIPRADLWVNGRPVLGSGELAGAYVTTSVDVTEVVQPGTNALALLVYPGNPMEDLSIGWVDWSQSPPDDNMGPWRDVVIERSGDVRLSSPHVVSELPPGGVPSPADRSPARLRISVVARNHGRTARAVELTCSVEGHGTALLLRRELSLAPGSSETVRFSEGDDGEGGAAAAAAGVGGVPGGHVAIADAALWWPIGEGDQPLYRLGVTATATGVLSDHVETSFGVRTVDSEVCPGGGRRFRVNGHPVQILGAGWSPDLFLRHDERRLADQLALTAHMGLNTIRPEGKLENSEFYDLCDRLGIMVLPGWECCNKWEAAAGMGGVVWDEHDGDVAERSMASEAELLRNHPSVIGFLIGSDFAPPKDVAERYVRALGEAEWDLPVVASATVQGSEVTGPSGMKMTGPYDWVPPVYWYDRDPELGGAVGFNSETSAGHTVPRLPSLRRMLSPAELDQLWQRPTLRQYHSGPPSEFDNLAIFGRALSARYGPPKSAEDFVMKAQLASYEAVRAQFEAFTSRNAASEPATGVVYWMLTAPWPSLNWQLFDYFLDTPGSFAGARKALEPFHVLYAYDTRSVHVLNRDRRRSPEAALTVRRWRLDGLLLHESRHPVAPLDPGATVALATIETPEGVVGTWFLELELSPVGWSSPGSTGGRAERGGGEPPPWSRNVYWLSSTEDVLDRSSTTWHSTGVSQFADLQGLGWLRAAQVDARASARQCGDGVEIALTVDHADPSGTPLVALHASVLDAGLPVTPVHWDDNDVTLFREQRAVLTGRIAASSASLASLRIQLEALNFHRPLVIDVD